MKKLLLGFEFAVLAILILTVASCGVGSSGSNQSPSDTIALGQDVNPVQEMLNGRGYSFRWNPDIGGYVHTPFSGLRFILFESGGIIDEVVVVVSNPPTIKWEDPTDRFFEDLNLPMPINGGMGNLHNEYGDQLSIVTGSGRVRVYPQPGLEFTIENIIEDFVYYFLTYSLAY